MKRMVWRVVFTLIVVAGVGAGEVSAALSGPEAIREKVKAAGEAEKYPGAAHVIVLDESECRVRPSGVATTDRVEVVKLLTDAAVRSYSAQTFEYDPATNRLAVRAVRVHRKDGSTEEVDLGTMVHKPAPAWAIYWGNQVHMLSIPRLEIGDAVEMVTSKTGFNIAYLSESGGGGGGGRGGGEDEAAGLIPPMPGHWYETVYFQARVPILEMRYTVRLPREMPIQYEIYHGTLAGSLKFEGEEFVYSWEARDVPALKSEPHMIAFSDAATKLVMATLGDWEAKSRWFHEVNEPQFAADEEIRAKVAELTEGLADEQAKIAALQHWVADHVRYIGTSRGPCEGYTLHTGIETFRDRGGVCKDKAGMLITMLRAAGLEAYPVLTQAGSDVEVIPADQFNHTVVSVRHGDGSLQLLDPTWVPLSREYWSTREALQAVVHGVPEGRGLELSPYYGPEQNSITARSEAVIGPDGRLAARMRWDEAEGYPDTYLRRGIHGQNARRLAGWFEEQFARLGPQVRVAGVEHIDPYDYSRPAFVDARLEAPDYALGHDGQRLFHLPLMSHPLAGVFAADLLYELGEKREFGLRLRATRRLVYEETIRLPSGWEIVDRPKDREIENEAATLKFSATAEADELRYRFEIQAKHHIVEPKVYADYKKAIDGMNEISGAWIVCKTTEEARAAVADARDAQEGEATHAVQ